MYGNPCSESSPIPRQSKILAQKLAEHHAGQADDYARAQHSQLYQVERGNPKRTFVGMEFKEKSDSKR